MDKEPGGGFGLILAAVGMGLCCAVPFLAAWPVNYVLLKNELKAGH